MKEEDENKGDTPRKGGKVAEVPQKRETPSGRRKRVISEEVFREETLDLKKEELKEKKAVSKRGRKVEAEKKEDQSEGKAKPKRGKRPVVSVEREETGVEGAGASQVRKRGASTEAGSSPKKARVVTKGTRSSSVKI